MTKQPNSDQTGRAARRRQEKEVERAQRTVARAENPQGVPVTTKDLLSKIGVLTVEVDFWKQRYAQLEEHVNRVPLSPLRGNRQGSLTPRVGSAGLAQPPRTAG